MRKVMGVSLDAQLWERVDAARGDVPRSVFVRRALEGALDFEALKEMDGGSLKRDTAEVLRMEAEEPPRPAPPSKPKGNVTRVQASPALKDLPVRPASELVKCPRHPTAGKTKGPRGTYCAEPGCTVRLDR